MANLSKTLRISFYQNRRSITKVTTKNVAHFYVSNEFISHTCGHRCDKRLQRLQKILCKRVYYFVNVYLNKNHERNEAKL